LLSGLATGRAQLELANRNGLGFVADGGDLTEVQRGKWLGDSNATKQRTFPQLNHCGILVALSALESLARKEAKNGSALEEHRCCKEVMKRWCRVRVVVCVGGGRHKIGGRMRKKLMKLLKRGG
jgi:hypothetical protein